MNLNIKKITQKIKPVLLENGVLTASVFGSVARGEATEKSDLDLLLTYNDSMSFFDIARLQIKLEKLLGCKVDLISRNSIKSRLKQYILKDEISIL